MRSREWEDVVMPFIRILWLSKQRLKRKKNPKSFAIKKNTLIVETIKRIGARKKKNPSASGGDQTRYITV